MEAFEVGDWAVILPELDVARAFPGPLRVGRVNADGTLVFLQPGVKAIGEQNVSTQTVEALKSSLNEFIIEAVQELYKT